MVRLTTRIGTSAENLKIPDERLSLVSTGSIIERLTQLTSNRDILSGLRTIKQSLVLFDSGLQIHTGATEGNVSDPVREEAITANILDVLQTVQPGSVLGLYGAVHVQKGTRTFRDPKGDTFQFTPLSERLEKAGVRVYRTICYPLAGAGMWRQQSFNLPAGPEASEFGLSSGETMQDVLRSVPDSEFFYFDLAKGGPLRIQIQAPLKGTGPKAFENFKQQIRIQPMFLGAVTDNLNEQFDSFIFLREATPMKDQCPAINK